MLTSSGPTSPCRQVSGREQADRKLPGPARREPHADEADERADERRDARAVAEVAAEVGTEREEGSRDGYVAHCLREQDVRPAAGRHSDSLVAQ
jgi:hypothetical protein